MTTMVPLEDDDTVAHSEVRTFQRLHNRTHTLMPQEPGAIVNLAIMIRPDAGTFQANRRDFRFDNGIARFDHRIGPINQFKAARLRNSQYCVSQCTHVEITALFLKLV